MSETENKLAIKNPTTGKIINYDYGEHAGVGMQHSDEGGTVPFLELLQPLSDVVKNDEVEGAKPGKFYIKSSRRLFDGKAGVNFIAVAEQHTFVEWVPRSKGGGFVGDHDPTSDVVRRCREKYGPRKLDWQTEDGNSLNETFRLYGFIVEDWGDLARPERLIPVIITFDRMKLKARAGFMDRLRMQKRAIPLYAVKLKITSKLQQSKKGDFQNYVVSFAEGDDLFNSLILPTDPVWAEWAPAAKRLADEFYAGRIKADAPANENTDEGDDGIPF